jgi:hypothetical protein
MFVTLGPIHCVELHYDEDSSVKHQTVALTLKDYFEAVKECLESGLSTRVLLDLHGKVCTALLLRL